MPHNSPSNYAQNPEPLNAVHDNDFEFVARNLENRRVSERAIWCVVSGRAPERRLKS